MSTPAPAVPVPAAPRRRTRWPRVALVAVLAVAVGVAAYRSRGVVGRLGTLPAPDWRWLAVAAGLLGSTYLVGAVALLLASGRRLPVGRTLGVQLAAAVVNRVVPAGIGGAAVNVRYLRRIGVPGGRGAAAVGAVSVSHGVASVLLVAVALPFAGGLQLAPRIPTPSPVTVAAAVVVLALLTVAVVAIRRRPLPARVRTVLVQAYDGARSLRHRPLAALGLLGTALVNRLAHAFALFAALRAFGGDLRLPLVLVVYLGGVALAGAVPTPAGVGSVEAVLVATLTAVGGAAVVVTAAVLAFRALVVLLPVAPGLWAWRTLRQPAAAPSPG